MTRRIAVVLLVLAAGCSALLPKSREVTASGGDGARTPSAHGAPTCQAAEHEKCCRSTANPNRPPHAQCTCSGADKQGRCNELRAAANAPFRLSRMAKQLLIRELPVHGAKDAAIAVSI